MVVRKFVKFLYANGPAVMSIELPRGIYFKLQLALFNLEPDNHVGQTSALITEHGPFVSTSGQNIDFEVGAYQSAEGGPNVSKLEDVSARGVPIERPFLNVFAPASRDASYIAVIYEYEPTQRI